VRGVVALILLGSVVLARAQEQDRKMLDRLLKPDMTLQNNAQGKQFVARGATLSKSAPTKSFYVAETRKQKRFWNTRGISPKPFATESSQFARAEANLSTRNQITKLKEPYTTASYSGVREAADAQKAVATSEFAGNRKFEGRGKSQTALSAQDHPLTIEQVRELLNKNK
jgi:hypothetical protein